MREHLGKPLHQASKGVEPSPTGLSLHYREEQQGRHFARRTVSSYEQWLRRLHFHRPRPPREMGSVEVNAFLNHLAVDLQVSASRQNQALSALLFLYRDLLRQGKGGKDRRTSLPHRLA